MDLQKVSKQLIFESRGDRTVANSPVCGNSTAAHSIDDLVGQCWVGNDANCLGVELFDEAV